MDRNQRLHRERLFCTTNGQGMRRKQKKSKDGAGRGKARQGQGRARRRSGKEPLAWANWIIPSLLYQKFQNSQDLHTGDKLARKGRFGVGQGPGIRNGNGVAGASNAKSDDRRTWRTRPKQVVGWKDLCSVDTHLSKIEHAHHAHLPSPNRDRQPGEIHFERSKRSKRSAHWTTFPPTD